MLLLSTSFLSIPQLSVKSRKRTLETEAFHLESLKAVLEIAEKNGRSVVGQIRDILAEGEEHLRHLKER